jgi:hypothetical protein
MAIYWTAWAVYVVVIAVAGSIAFLGPLSNNHELMYGRRLNGMELAGNFLWALPRTAIRSAFTPIPLIALVIGAVLTVMQS